MNTQKLAPFLATLKQNLQQEGTDDKVAEQIIAKLQAKLLTSEKFLQTYIAQHGSKGLVSTEEMNLLGSILPTLVTKTETHTVNVNNSKANNAQIGVQNIKIKRDATPQQIQTALQVPPSVLPSTTLNVDNSTLNGSRLGFTMLILEVNHMTP